MLLLAQPLPTRFTAFAESFHSRMIQIHNVLQGLSVTLLPGALLLNRPTPG